VTHQAIFADYLLSARLECLSNPVRRAMVADIVSRLAGGAQSEAMVDAIMDARPQYLQTALDTVSADFGSMEAYIRHAVGWRAQDLYDLRQRWLTRSP
jgi:protein-tyrosine phosphatase